MRISNILVQTTSLALICGLLLANPQTGSAAFDPWCTDPVWGDQNEERMFCNDFFHEPNEVPARCDPVPAGQAYCGIYFPMRCMGNHNWEWHWYIEPEPECIYEDIDSGYCETFHETECTDVFLD